MSVRVRFAPSPTGQVHIGNMRVAIFNWLLARNRGGAFLLRVEDTDRERSTPEAIAKLLAAMRWLGLDYDEEPVYQSRRAEAHLRAARELAEGGHASAPAPGEPTILHIHAGLFDPAFVSEPCEEAAIDVAKGRLLADHRGLRHEIVDSKGRPHLTPYNWDALAELVLECDQGECGGGEARNLVRETTKTVDVGQALGRRVRTLRFKRRYVFFRDLVLGLRRKPLESLRDQVIVRSDGTPVFHLANVLDDIHMRVTHVCRGNDHVENTFRHLFLYRALGVRAPVFAHFPMIVNAKGRPYSKRDGDAYVGDFRARGVLAEALFNFLALCGWSPGDGRELMNREELTRAFDLGRVSAAPSRLDADKLEWMNCQYLRRLPRERVADALLALLAERGLPVEGADRDWLRRLVELHLEHVNGIPALADATAYFFQERVELQEKAKKKVLLKKNGAGLENLRRLRPLLARISAQHWREAELERTVTGLGRAEDIKLGDLAQPLRVAVTGTTVSRGIFAVLELLGRGRTLARIDRVLASVTPPQD